MQSWTQLNKTLLKLQIFYSSQTKNVKTLILGNNTKR